ncbi:MAG TPA: hypothetical protein PLE53_06785 [Bacillota bacterium]|nr:hypothetical protein [Bacillota bacterium]
MIVKKPFLFVVITFVLAGMLAGCAGAPVETPGGQAEGKYGGTFRLAITESPKNLNPVHANDTSSMRVVYQLFDTLVGIDSEGELVPTWQSPGT